MKKTLSFMIVVLGFSTGLYSKCINILHQKKREILGQGGIKQESNEYSCLIKPSEEGVFDENGNCKFCGCNVADHDNT